MAYNELTHETVCSKCAVNNHVIVAYSGDYRANEREAVDCYECGEELETEKCWAIYSAATAEKAMLKLRKMQNRA
jgi:hypothetical protein